MHAKQHYFFRMIILIKMNNDNEETITCAYFSGLFRQKSDNFWYE